MLFGMKYRHGWFLLHLKPTLDSLGWFTFLSSDINGHIMTICSHPIWFYFPCKFADMKHFKSVEYKLLSDNRYNADCKYLPGPSDSVYRKYGYPKLTEMGFLCNTKNKGEKYVSNINREKITFTRCLACLEWYPSVVVCRELSPFPNSIVPLRLNPEGPFSQTFQCWYTLRWYMTNCVLGKHVWNMHCRSTTKSKYLWEISKWHNPTRVKPHNV